VLLTGKYSRKLVPFSPKFCVADIDGQAQDMILWATFGTIHATPVLFIIPFTDSPMMKKQYECRIIFSD
jgi:hypothetical protein